MRRRWLVSAVCFLALGAVSTVALCWLAAGVRVEVGTWVWPPEGRWDGAGIGRWCSWEGRSWCATFRWLSVCTELEDRRASIEAWPAWSRVRGEPRHWADEYFEGAYGWPWDAMWHREDQARIRFMPSDAQVDIGLPVEVVSAGRPYPDRPSALPTHLTWAFIGDTVVHAVLWYGLLQLVRGPGRLLAWRRRRRRTCVRCGYDCSATPRRCPECGYEVAARQSPWRPAIGLPAVLVILGAAALVGFAAVGRDRFVSDEDPIERAARLGDIDIVRDIVARGASSFDVAIAASSAAAHDQREVFRALVTSIDSEYASGVIIAAIANGHVELAREALRQVSDDDGVMTVDLINTALDAGQTDLASELFESRFVLAPEDLVSRALRSAPPDLMRRLVARLDSDATFHFDASSWSVARRENLEILLERLVPLAEDELALSCLAEALEWARLARRADLSEVVAAHMRRLIDGPDCSRWSDRAPGIVETLWSSGRPDLIVRIIARLREDGVLDAIITHAVDFGRYETIMALIHCGVDVVAFDPDGVRAMCDTWEAELANDPSPWLSEVLSLAAVRARLAEFDAASAGGD
ncbi:MAG: hypothetical protein KDA25_01575 [Phycisphaerales bacterium]|nr:hypothetical protein [Phycisphaerales bacterium]